MVPRWFRKTQPGPPPAADGSLSAQEAASAIFADDTTFDMFFDGLFSGAASGRERAEEGRRFAVALSRYRLPGGERDEPRILPRSMEQLRDRVMARSTSPGAADWEPFARRLVRLLSLLAPAASGPAPACAQRAWRRELRGHKGLS